MNRSEGSFNELVAEDTALRRVSIVTDSLSLGSWTSTEFWDSGISVRLVHNVPKAYVRKILHNIYIHDRFRKTLLRYMKRILINYSVTRINNSSRSFHVILDIIFDSENPISILFINFLNEKKFSSWYRIQWLAVLYASADCIKSTHKSSSCMQIKIKMTPICFYSKTCFYSSRSRIPPLRE